MSRLPDTVREERRWLAAAGTRMHVRRWSPEGREPAPERIVLVHGLGVSSRYLVPVGRELGRTHDVAAPDLPGFGHTPYGRSVLDVRGLADALLAWLDAAAVPDAVFLGNSMGCQILADLAVRHPARVRGLVLTGPTFDAGARTTPRQATRLVSDMVFERPSLPFVLALEYVQCGPRRYWLTYRSGLADRIEDKLPQVAVPVLVTRGGLDPIAPQAWVERLVARTPKARLAVVPRVGHNAHYSAAPRLAQLVRSWLPEVAAGSR